MSLQTLFTGLLLFFNIEASIVEIKYMRDIMQYVDKDGFFIFDLDNTVYEPTEEIGSYQWCDSLISREMKKEKYPNATSVIQKVAPICEDALQYVDFQLIEEITPFIIKELQSKGLPVMALTLRHAYSSSLTVKQLLKLGICFAKQLFKGIQNVYLDSIGKSRPFFYEGILFCNGCYDKGEVLEAYFKAISFYPEKIFMVDDNLENLKNVERMCRRLGIEFIGLNYTFLRNKVNNFVLRDFMIPVELL